MSRICAIVVTYQPDIELLRESVLTSRAQVERLVVVDNASAVKTRQQLENFVSDVGCEFLQLGENLGVAAAQNRGVAWARQHDCSHVLLLDQDSVPSPDMVERLLAAMEGLVEGGTRVAAVGPRLVDRRTGLSTPFIHIGLLSVRKRACTEDGARLIETDFLVSSGMLIRLEVLDRVGLPEEGLFIDNVDLEWCFRARASGLVLYGVCDAVLTHSIGDQVFKFYGRVLYLHGPLRQYYIMRNRILLYRRSYSPWGWVVQDFFRMLFKFAVFSLIVPPRLQNFRMMFKGLVDGLGGKTGKPD